MGVRVAVSLPKGLDADLAVGVDVGSTSLPTDIGEDDDVEFDDVDFDDVDFDDDVAVLVVVDMWILKRSS